MMAEDKPDKPQSLLVQGPKTRSKSQTEDEDLNYHQRKFFYEISRIDKYCEKWWTIEESDHTEAGLMTYMEQLNKHISLVDAANEAIQLSNADEKTRKTCTIAYDNSSDNSLNTRLRINELLNKLQPNSELTNDYTPAVTINQAQPEPQSYLKVPACDTEIFYGGYEDWPSFRDMFTAVYINHPKLSQAQKLYHLRQKTRGKAALIIKNYALNNLNFELAWDALKSRYENRRIVVDNQIKTLFNLQPANNENAEKIQQIQTTINNCLSTLKANGVSTESWDPLLIYLCSSKLPDETLALWEQSLNSRKELPLWSEMDQFLTTRYEVVERLNTYKPNKQKLPQPNFTPRTPASAPQNFNFRSKTNTFFTEPKRTVSCKLCNSNHSMMSCMKFKELSVYDRNKFVKEQNYCKNCLAFSHSEDECRSNFTCVYCQKRHHSLLHYPPKAGVLQNKPQPSRTQTLAKSKPAKNYVTSQVTIEQERPCTSKQAAEANTSPKNNDKVLSHFSSN